MGLYVLDYGAGNVRSVFNALGKFGFEYRIVEKPDDILEATQLIFPGVGAFGKAMEVLQKKGYAAPLKQYIDSGRPFLGICIGLQCLCEGSEESPGVEGLGIIKTTVRKFKTNASVPQIGWNTLTFHRQGGLIPAPPPSSASVKDPRYYFVHSFHLDVNEATEPWLLASSTYGGVPFVSAVQRGAVIATQFHPEKSGSLGLEIFRAFVEGTAPAKIDSLTTLVDCPVTSSGGHAMNNGAGAGCGGELAKRIIACLDVRTNDEGDLVVTKGDQYDVREEGSVRNLGKPVALAQRYYEEGADEVTFLNITSFRNSPLADLPMLQVLKRTSKEVFVPLTIGGGIRDFTDPDGTYHSALEVAGEYFRSGADKVSIGSDAVYAAEEYIQHQHHQGKPPPSKASQPSSIAQIAEVYGSQAVVISVDPRRVYVSSPGSTTHKTIETKFPGPAGDRHVWYQCTVKGGREGRDLGVYELVRACEAMGAGEILLNCIDKDGTNSGFDLELIAMVREAVSIPVIASSGAGRAEHFAEVFEATGAEAALAAGIFHRGEVGIGEVKRHLRDRGFGVRNA
ncbi:unnamed protein product [Vitrella brassicaformis CCMP3155]|uniref:Imidazole glycerol phosphate synthase hisHF n=2 Tax=Vitrella brassicaformis TaxID=1169539 RepID=A0A0G4EPL2_VITBC|nr:unnamed protein product [Vitrella brassicaformis CCMP3155]|eukprot:CEL99200.1 unnamed protein product [Vitrella brassicaformis CCMP3155]